MGNVAYRNVEDALSVCTDLLADPWDFLSCFTTVSSQEVWMELPDWHSVGVGLLVVCTSWRKAGYKIPFWLRAHMLETAMYKHEQGESKPADITSLLVELNVAKFEQLLSKHASYAPCNGCHRQVLTESRDGGRYRYCAGCWDEYAAEQEEEYDEYAAQNGDATLDASTASQW